MNEALSQRRVPDTRAPLGVSLSAFAGLSLLAVCLARALAPALPGSATGIAELIHATGFAAACASQLVATGGVALCLRQLGGLLPRPALGIAFRLAIVPSTLGVVGLTAASAARPIPPELSRIAAILAILALASPVPALRSSRRTRSVGLVLLIVALGASCDLGAYELSRRLGFARASSGALGSVLSGLGLGLDVLAALIAFLWVAERPRRIKIGLSIVAVQVTFAVWLSHAGSLPGASGALVVLNRSLTALSERSLLGFPSFLRQGLTLALILLAGALLFLPGRKSELKAALALGLLGRTATGAPAAALLSVGAALTALGAFFDFEAPPHCKSDRFARGGVTPRASHRPAAQ